MDCWPGVGATDETFWILVVPTVVVTPVRFTGVPGAPVVSLGTVGAGVCTLAALVDTTRTLLLAAVGAGVTSLGWLPVVAALVVTTVARAVTEIVVVGGAVGLFVAGACGLVVTVPTVGLDEAVTIVAGRVTAPPGFAGVAACVDFSPTSTFSVGLGVVAALCLLSITPSALLLTVPASVGAPVGPPGVAPFDTEVAFWSLEHTL